MLHDKEYFENLINSRKYWDIYSSEFNSITTDEKLLNIAEYLNLGGNLHYLISVYKRNKRIDIRNAVSQSIEFFLEELADDDMFLLREYSETQLITILSRELKSHCFYDYNVKLHKSEPKISYGNINLDLNIQEDKETLFYDNPWLDLVEEIVDNSYKPLNKNIHIEDQKYIDEFNSMAKEDYIYHLEILPEPFLGNVLYSEVAILTLNPGYVKQKNTEEYEELSENEKIEFVKDQCKSMSLQSSEFISTNSNRNSISDYYWDKKTKELRSKFKDANSKIALIQYIGYTSYKFKDLPKKITEKIYLLEEGLLYTQKFTVRLVEYLIQQKKVIIIARNENLWYKAVKGLKGYENLITLDNYRNTYITPNNCKKSGKWHLIESALTK